MLTGLVVFIYPGDAAQIAATIVIEFIFFALSEVLLPYQKTSDMWLSRGGHMVVFFSFFAALLYKVDVSCEQEASQQVFGVMMIVVHVCLILVVLVHGVGTWFSGRKIAQGNQLPRSRSGRLAADQIQFPGILLER